MGVPPDISKVFRDNPGIPRDTSAKPSVFLYHPNFVPKFIPYPLGVPLDISKVFRDTQGYPGTLWDMSESASKINRDTQGCFRDVQEA